MSCGSDPFINVMGETSVQEVTDLWTIVQATKVLIATNQTQIGLVQTALTTLVEGGLPDYAGISNSGEAGGESWTFVTLQARLDSLVEQSVKLFGLLEQQRRLAVKATPGFLIRRTRPSAFDERGHYW